MISIRQVIRQVRRALVANNLLDYLVLIPPMFEKSRRQLALRPIDATLKRQCQHYLHLRLDVAQLGIVHHDIRLDGRKLVLQRVLHFPLIPLVDRQCRLRRCLSDP